MQAGPANPLRAPSAIDNLMRSLASLGQARATTSAGMSAAGRMGELFQGLDAAMLTQGRPGEAANGLIGRFLRQLSDVIDISKIEDISMVQKGGVLVVVITMQEGHKVGQNPIPSSDLESHVDALKGLDASTPEGFDKAREIAREGAKAAIEAIERLKKVLEFLEKADEKVQSDLGGPDGTDATDGTSEMLALARSLSGQMPG